MAFLTDFTDTVQSLGTFTRTQNSPVIHIWSSTKFPQVWEGTNFSGSFLCAWGTHRIQLDPPASRETWLCGIFSSPQAAGMSLPLCGCESHRSQVCKPPSLVKLVKLSDSARSFQEGWTDTQSLEKESPDLSFEPELMKVPLPGL